MYIYFNWLKIFSGTKNFPGSSDPYQIQIIFQHIWAGAGARGDEGRGRSGQGKMRAGKKRAGERGQENRATEQRMGREQGEFRAGQDEVRGRRGQRYMLYNEGKLS